jgi:hypothetical protein
LYPIKAPVASDGVQRFLYVSVVEKAMVRRDPDGEMDPRPEKKDLAVLLHRNETLQKEDRLVFKPWKNGILNAH